MPYSHHAIRFERCLLLAIILSGFIGCHQAETSVPNTGTTSNLVLPATDPPLLTKALAERIKTGNSQSEVIGILQAAANDKPAAKSLIDAVAAQAALNSVRFDLTIAQSDRQLVLAFKDNKLVKMQQVGLE